MNDNNNNKKKKKKNSNGVIVILEIINTLEYFNTYLEYTYAQLVMLQV